MPLNSRSPSEIIERIEGPQDPDRQGYDADTLEELMAREGVPGVGIAAIKDFQIHWTKSYGIADVETGARVDEDTPFQAASISQAHGGKGGPESRRERSVRAGRRHQRHPENLEVAGK